ncbi:MAG: hypothetical protein ACFFD2_08450 [Promethearchaeota archaeon]
MNVMSTFTAPNSLSILGVGLIKVLKISAEKNFEVVFQLGIGIPLIQNVFEIFKQEFHEKSEGTSIIPLEHFAMFINYFKNQTDEFQLLIYMYDKENTEIYSQLYLHSRKIKGAILSGTGISSIIEICKDTIKIPQVAGLKGIYILGLSGIPLFSKTNKKRIDLDDSQLVGGLISALFNFSQHLIGEDSGGKLKEINFGNQSFYMITKNDVIFVYLVEKMTPLLKRYMYIMADEFLDKYRKDIKEFDGNITPFQTFNDILDHYFVIEKK